MTELDPSSVGSEVWCGKESGNYTITKIGVSTVYSQLYPYEGLLNYTSGIIHHVRLEGMDSTNSFNLLELFVIWFVCFQRLPCE